MTEATQLSHSSALSIKEDSAIIYDKVVRQDRIDVSASDCSLTAGDRVFQILDCSPFGLALRSPTPLQAGFTAESAMVRYEGQEIGMVSFCAIRTESQSGGAYKVACELVGEPLAIEKIEAIRQVREMFESEERSQAAYSSIPGRFRHETLEMKEILEGFQAKVAELEKSWKGCSLGEISVLEDAAIGILVSTLKKFVSPRIDLLRGSVHGLDPAGIKEAYGFFREKLGKFLYQSAFSERSYSKPLGYAGDFEMMNILYRNENIGSSLFAKALHRFTVDMPAARAVRNRSFYLKRKLEELIKSRRGAQLTTLSVASGPAREVQLMIESEVTQEELGLIQFHLLDQDLFSLKHAQRSIRELCWKTSKKASVSYHHKTIKRVISAGLDGQSYDLIYSAGLFDYFSDPVAKLAAKKLYESLVPGGRLIIGNFDIANPTRFFMESALDWQLIYRSEEDLRRIFGNLGGDSIGNLEGHLVVEKEDEGINLFCVVTKGG